MDDMHRAAACAAQGNQHANCIGFPLWRASRQIIGVTPCGFRTRRWLLGRGLAAALLVAFMYFLASWIATMPTVADIADYLA
jgi:hypothetical protein